MTEELLKQGNALVNRIKDVDELLLQLDLTDPSGFDSTTRISPIVIQTGMAKTIQFDVLPADENMTPTAVQTLDASIHSMLVEILKSYKSQLVEMFTNLA